MEISVIIPAYNVEDTIGKCLDSVLMQDYPLKDIIVVEDCSTDGTLEKLQEYQGLIKIISHTENMGIGQTRRDGIAAANGDWLYFLDSDDYIDQDAIGYLVKNADNGDIITGGVSQYPLSGLDAVLHYKKCKTTFLNNRLIKRSLFNQATHSAMRYLEDLDTLPRLIYYAGKCTFAPERKYHYNTVNRNSLNATSTDLKRWIYLCLTNIHNFEFFLSFGPEWTRPLGYGLDIIMNLALIYNGLAIYPEYLQKYSAELNEIRTHLVQALSVPGLEWTAYGLSTTPNTCR